MKRILFFILFCVIHKVFGQDIHFSMLDISPLSLNAAQTGNFDGTYRFSLIHRDQWRSVTVPFVTSAISLEASQPFKALPALDVGLFMMNDKAGDSKFSTFSFNPSVSYHLFIKKDSSQLLRFGIRTGFTNRAIDFSALRFDEQYNGYIYDPNLSNGESFSGDSRFYGDVHAGVIHTMVFSQTFKVETGISWMNVLAPKQSFDGLSSIKLDRRWVLNVMGQYKLNETYTLLPNILYMPQGKYKELTLGSLIKYNSTSTLLKTDALYLGLFTRVRDAFSISIGADFKQIHGRINYDINYSHFVPATNRRGAFEIGVVYIYKALRSNRVKYKRCPDFL